LALLHQLLDIFGRIWQRSASGVFSAPRCRLHRLEDGNLNILFSPGIDACQIEPWQHA